MLVGFTRCLLLCALVFRLVGSSHVQAQTVPSPAQVALRELHGLQLRTPELWRRRDEQCIGCGAAAVAVGVPVAGILLPIGAIIYANSSYSDYYYEGEWDAGYSDQDVKHDRRLGGMLMALGGLGVAAIAWGAWKIAAARRARRAIDRELRSVNERRTLLEQMLESLTTGPRGPVTSVPTP